MAHRRLIPIGFALIAFPVAASWGAEASAIAEARDTFQTLVEAYVNANGDAGGTLQVKDPATGRLTPLRFLRCDPTTVRQLDDGVFAGEVLLRGAKGRQIYAQAVEDLRSAHWAISRLEIIGPKRTVLVRDRVRLVGAAVLAYVQAAAKRDGAFVISDDAAGRERRLRLKMIPSDQLAALDETHYRSCVFFTDLDDHSSVDVDFLVSLASDSGQVYRTAVHGVDGKLRFTYDRSNNVVPTNAAHAPQTVQ